MSADTFTFGGGGAWTTAANWSDGVPTATSDVVVGVEGVPIISSDVGSIDSLSVAPYGSIWLEGGGALKVNGTAGAGSNGVETCDLLIDGGSASAVLEFASGQIATIAAAGTLTLEGAQSFVADVGALGSDSALTGLTEIAGTLDLEDGSSLTLAGILNVSGQIDLGNGAFLTVGGLNNSYGIVDVWAPRGATLEIDGALTNGGDLEIGESGRKDEGSVTAKGLVNNDEIVLSTIAKGGNPLKIDGVIANNGVILVDDSRQTFYWWIGGSGSGAFVLQGDATIGFHGGVDSHQLIDFEEPDDRLALDDTSAFFGRISGFGASDSIEVKDFGGGTKFDYIEGSSGKGGFLTLTDGSHTERLNFQGSYSLADFSPVPSGQGWAISFV